uniref:Uncharacterized protein n=1 Tax=Colletotrichum fructicola (strain Nara gc5) TaxID=1213859 RepID=L2FMF1_COLFN
MGASAQSVNAPPVPNVPDAYRPDSQQAGNANRYTASSRYGTENQSDTNSILSLWGGGVNHPREQAPPPQTPRRGWIEKCIKFGGLK